MASALRSTKLRWMAASLVSVLILCAPAFLNGGPLLFPDTVSYLVDGQLLARLHRSPNIRPIFYGLLTWPLSQERSAWPIVLAQAAIVVHLLALTARAVGLRLTPALLLGGAVLLALLTPLSWYVSHVLPDVFAGVLVLALFLLGACHDRLGRGEAIYLVLLATAATSLHLTHVALAAALCATSWVAWLAWPSGRRLLRPLLVTAPLVLALAATFAYSFAAFGNLRFTQYGPPILLARVIADGPGRTYLERTCPEQRYQICPYLAQLPQREEDILWRFLPTVDFPDYKRFQAEQGVIVLGTARMFPWAVASHALLNAARQLISFGSESTFAADNLDNLTLHIPRIGEAARGTRQLTGLFGGAAMKAVNTVHAAVASLSLLAALWLLFNTPSRPAMLLLVILESLLVNAFAAGALSGVFGRYQGRLIWLLPLGALLAGLALLRRRDR